MFHLFGMKQTKTSMKNVSNLVIIPRYMHVANDTKYFLGVSFWKSSIAKSYWFLGLWIVCS